MRHTLLCVLLAFAHIGAYAQWANYPTPGIPRTRDGKPNLNAPVPRASNGKPDLSGVWHVAPPPPDVLKVLRASERNRLALPGMEPETTSKYGVNILADFKPEDSPIRPEAAAILKRRQSGAETMPPTYCLPAGVPLATLLSEVHKIIQTPRLIAIMLELDNATRQIYLDGRKLPVDPLPSWLGYSVGRWDGDTLVVESVGFNDKTWLDVGGHPHSDAMRLVERYRRRDFGHLEEETTIDDPKMYTRPFTIKETHLFQADADILEYFCAENEKDRSHMGLK